jgi:drug/metabolite transporter (DMT)-like permease
MGICAFTIGNGAVFWGLKYLPATTVSLMMSFIPLLILFMSIFWLKEKPTPLQIIGVSIAIIGSALFFYSDLQGGHPIGIIFVIVGLIGFSVFGILGRELAKNKLINTLIRTSIPMGLGGGLLIIPALIIEGTPTLSVTVVSVVLVLAFFHTAFGYFLYNKALEKLTALEMNMILNLMPLGTAFFAWLLLGENITVRQLVGIFIVISGVVMVQMGNTNKYQKSIS